MDFITAGHEEITTIADDEAWAKSLQSPDGKLDRPVCIKKSPTLEALMKVPAVEETIKLWLTEFPKNTTEEQVTAPLDRTRGLKEICTAAEVILPEIFAFHSGIPTVKRWKESAAIYGYSEHMHRFSFEPEPVGSLRFMVQGEVSYLMASFSDIKAVVAPEEPTARRAYELCTTYMANLTEVEVKEMVTKCKLVVAHLKSPCVLLVPPGYIVTINVLNNELVAGFRQPFLPRGRFRQ